MEILTRLRVRFWRLPLLEDGQKSLPIVFLTSSSSGSGRNLFLKKGGRSVSEEGVVHVYICGKHENDLEWAILFIKMMT